MDKNPQALKRAPVRVRFAPSPTGHLHVGGARTALFNWLFARKLNGVFVLRIEDTDEERSTEESFRTILSSLRWLGLDWDEGPEAGGEYGPYRQSLRQVLYRSEADRMVREGKAYRCFCSKQELDAMRSGSVYAYDGRCGRLNPQEVLEREESSDKHVIRFRMPASTNITWKDLTRGELDFRTDVLDDFVLIKSDGNPTYNFAAVVDDAKMRISHVIRGDDHISNTPKQIVLYEELGFPVPEFGHLPMIVGTDRQRLSKRHGAMSVEQFRLDGILPQALINYLALLGWAPADDREIFEGQELVAAFELSQVGKAAAVFDSKKLQWMNGEHFSRLSLGEKVRRLLPKMKEEGMWPPQFRIDLTSGPHLRVVTSGGDSKIAGSIIPMTEEEWMKEEPSLAEELPRLKLILQALGSRISGPHQVRDLMDYFYVDDFAYESKAVAKHLSGSEAAQRLRTLADRIEAMPQYNVETLERALRQLADALGVKAAHLIHPARVALTGRSFSPGIFDVFFLLGRPKSLERLRLGADIAERNAEMDASKD